MAALDELKPRVEALLSKETGAQVTVTVLQPLAGGACQDNYRVVVTADQGELKGEHRLALRSDAKQSLPMSIGRKDEFHVIGAAVAAGVRTPRARWLSEGLVRDGGWAYFLDWVDGEAIGRRVIRNPELEAARAKLPEELAQNLAKLHTVTQKNAKLSLPNSNAEATPSRGALLFARKMIDGLPEPRPALEWVMKWLEKNEPAPVPHVLVHGDYRTGNFMVTPDGLSAVLDWEFAHFGDPAEDLAWISVRDWRFGRLDKPVGGFARREPFYDAYAKHTGRPVDPRRVLWWEVMGNVRWGTGSIYQGERYLSGEEQDLELIAIARRANEMEFEALRLIDEVR